MEKSEIEGLWTHIHWLSVLEEHGTYTAAAARLGVSKSAVSQRISDLEKATGTRLVTRTTLDRDSSAAPQPAQEPDHVASEPEAPAIVPLPAGGFLQAVPEAEAAMVSRAVEAVRGAKKIADLFCGAGTFTFPLAEVAAAKAAR